MSTVTLAYAPSSGTASTGPFADCALIEIIHLHDCLRGALNQLKSDVQELVHVSACLPDDATETCQVDAGNVTSDESSSSSDPQSASTSSTEKIFKIREAAATSNLIASRFHLIWSVFQAHSNAEDEIIWPALKAKVIVMNQEVKNCGCASQLGQEEYEEDHATEEVMFKQIDVTIRRLNASFRFYHASKNDKTVALGIIKKPILMLKDQVERLTSHLVKHLAKEETQCLPMVQKHLSKEEIAGLVGKIMGKRSAEVMTKILNLAVHSLPDDERADMVFHMKKAMTDTFFEKWLTMGGWSSTVKNSSTSKRKRNEPPGSLSGDPSDCKPVKIVKVETGETSSSHHPSRYYTEGTDGEVKLVWRSSEANPLALVPEQDVPRFSLLELTPKFVYNPKKGEMSHGCEHYERSCKLVHPKTNQLFTCRLCCDDQREVHKYNDAILPVLDRNAVKEVMCMHCGSLQPAGPKCLNEECGKKFAHYSCSICNLYDNDQEKSIYHCPYCNVCRNGKGLGIDFQHCMRCNACVRISEFDTHKCISQSLQGNCPICHETLFESTVPLRRMDCGHVMHLNCFNTFVMQSTSGSRRKRVRCPLCKKGLNLNYT